MSEAETTVTALVEANKEAPKDAKAERQSKITVVTAENFDQYVTESLSKDKPADPEEAGKAELAKVEEEKKAKVEEEIDHPDEKKKGRLNERFSELTEKRKAAEAAAETARQEAKQAKEQAEALQRERDELKAKYEPVKADPDPEPQPDQFANATEYGKALKDWAADNTRREDAKKAAQAAEEKRVQQIANEWQERSKSYGEANPDYAKDIVDSQVKVSDQVRDAIVESEVGPAILHHLAKNPTEADRIAKLTVGGALRAIGRLEATILKDAPQTEAKPMPAAQVSKAPAPITPLKNASAPVTRLTGHDPVPTNMSYEQWKKLRQAGSIQ